VEADVIVIGAGGAGMIAAMTAADAGASVLHLEKLRRIGGVWAYRGGTISGAGTEAQARAGILNDSPALYYSDLLKWEQSHDWTEPEVLRHYCEQSGLAVDWLDRLGAFQTPTRPSAGMYGDPWTVPRALGVSGPLLKLLMPEYQKYLTRHKIKLLTGTGARSLIEREGRVTGVRVRLGNGRLTDCFAGAVVICTGGFGYDLELVRRNLPGASRIVSHTPAFARGEGMALCQLVGAALVNLDHTLATGPYTGAVPSPQNSFRSVAQLNTLHYPGVIWIDVEGRRIVNEDSGGYGPAVRQALLKAPGHEMHIILDHQIRETQASPFISLFGIRERSWDWFDEKATEGVVIKRADTVAELAAKLDVPKSNLVDTVRRWNRFVAAGKDGDFNRQELSTKLEHPPYYGVRTVTMVIATSGGPAVNHRQEVINEAGRVIRGLYAAGEVAGYQGLGTGCFTTGNIVFGRRAGNLAAIEAIGSQS